MTDEHLVKMLMVALTEKRTCGFKFTDPDFPFNEVDGNVVWMDEEPAFWWKEDDHRETPQKFMFDEITSMTMWVPEENSFEEVWIR